MPTADDLRFQELTLKNLWITEQQLQECLETLHNYEQAGLNKPLSHIVLEKGYMTARQVGAIHQLQGKQSEYFIRGFTVLETLGQGGLGTVYKARQDSVGRIVALKIMHEHLGSNQQFIQRFMREARMCASLDHPNIVRGIDFGESDGVYYLAMEYVEGQSLKECVEKQGRLEELHAMRLMQQVGQALKYAEEHNLVHRDIKPENILLTPQGLPKLCDLGLAKPTELEEGSVTHTGIVVGTPHYLSPEAGMGGKDLDIRSDIYSLGVTLYYLVTADLPYKGGSAINIIGQHMTADAPSPQDKNPALSADICHVIRKMMAKNRMDRYQTAQEMLVDFNRLLRSERPLAAGSASAIKPTATMAQQVRPQAEPFSPMQSDPVSDEEFRTAATMDLDSKVIQKQLHETSVAVQISRGEGSSPRREESIVRESRELVKGLEKEVLGSKGKRPGSRALRRAFAFLSICLLAAGVYALYCLGGEEDLVAQIYSRFFTPPPQAPEPVKSEAKKLPDPYHAWDSLEKSRLEFEREKGPLAAQDLAFEERTRRMVRIDPPAMWNGEPLKSYYMDEHQVTRGEYENFCQLAGHASPAAWSETARREEKFADHPATDISFYDASLYALWAGKRLPTDAEWDYANYSGKLQQAQNLWEWTSAAFCESNSDCVVRKIGNSRSEGFLRNGRRRDLGFRCACDAPENAEKKDGSTERTPEKN